MDFSLTTLFVLGASNTLPTTGGTQNLTAGQFGVFKPDYTPATAGNVAAQDYIMLAQGRQQNYPGTGTKRSDKIYKANVLEWYKVSAFSTAANQIVDISNFTVQCGEDVTVSLRLKAFYIDLGYYNGLTKSFTVTAPCCDCGDDPCVDVDPEAIVDELVDLINGEGLSQFNQHNVSSFVVAERIGSGSSSTLRIHGKALAAEPTSADPHAFPFQYDRLMFWAYVYKGPETSQDFAVWEACDPVADVTYVQESTYARGTSKEAKQLEKNYLSYNTHPIAKRLFSNVNFNHAFTSEVVDGTYYDFYYLKFLNPDNRRQSWNHTVNQDEAVIILNPAGQNSGTITVLTTFLGTPTDATGSTSTTSTTTTTTTTT